MPYIIDGHNLVPHLPGLDLSHPDDEAELIRTVRDFCARKMVQAEIYFDRARIGAAGRRKFGRVTAVFVPTGKTADEAIIQRLKARRRAARSDIVVSSDRRVQTEARALGAAVLDSPGFAAQLESPGAEAPPENEPQMSEKEVAEWLSLFGDAGEGGAEP